MKYQWDVTDNTVKIVHNAFPIPTVPRPEPLLPATLTADTSIDSISRSPIGGSSSQRTEKIPTQGSSPPALPNDDSFATQPITPIVLNSQNSHLAHTDGALPPQLLSFYNNLKTTLTTSFPHAPPYTIQRLAELVLYPRRYYRTLPAYLRALDRTISVSSTSEVFPLPSSALDVVNSSSNGGHVTGGFLAAAGPEGAEEFNGAALTRIPWLRDSASMLNSSDQSSGGAISGGPTTDLRTESTSVIEGPNGTGSIETVTVAVNGVPSAGSSTGASQIYSVISDGVDASSLRPSAASAATVTDAPQPDDAGSGSLPRSPRSTAEEDEEVPHARGPEEIGMEDMGPQDAASATTGRTSSAGPAASLVDAEKAVGRPGEGELVGGQAALRDEESKTEDAGEAGRDGDSADAEGEADSDAMMVDEAGKEKKEPVKDG